MKSGRDQSREVGHIDPEFRADLVRYLLHRLEVLDARVGAPTTDDHRGVRFEGALADDLWIDAEGLRIHAVGFGMVETAREVDFHTVCEMPAVIEGESQNRIPWFDECLVDGRIGLSARMRLHVGVFRPEEILRTLLCDGFDLVHLLAATVITLTGITLGVFVGQHRTLRLQDGFRHEVLGSDHLQTILLSGELGVKNRCNFWIGL